MRGRAHLGTALAVLVSWATAAGAEGAADLRAVGLLERDGRSLCTAVLVEPDVVLTAAHCVQGGEDGSAPWVFLPGYKPGVKGAQYVIGDVTVHPVAGTAGSGGDEKSVSGDLALTRLQRQVPAIVAEPMETGALSGETAVFLMSYRGHRNLLRQRRCPVVAADNGMLEIACDVRTGESGAPLVVIRDGHAVVVGILSGRSKNRQQPVGLASDLATTLDGLKEAAGARQP